MNDLISVIIPVYNVEQYLERCINSVLNQTYENIEIILIDDGSTDKSGIICDKYAMQNSKIKVIHKPNEGISAVRNDGLNIAKGKYIGFIDSDDYIQGDMYEALYNNIISKNADISICKYIYKKEQQKVKIKDTCEIFCYNNIEALNHLLKNDEITNHLWNKLYKRELFDNIKFPKGKKYEDIAVMYKLFDKSKKVVYQDITKYIYINRENSILHNKNNQLVEDYIDVLKERYNNLDSNQDLIVELEKNMIHSILQIHIICIGGKLKEFYNSEEMKKLTKEVNDKIKRYGIKFLDNKYKVFGICLIFNRKIAYSIFSKLYINRKNKNNT